MPHLVPIDMTSVRRNPNAGQSVYYQYGQVHTESVRILCKGSRWWRLQYRGKEVTAYEWILCTARPQVWADQPDLQVKCYQDVQTIYTLCPGPAWLYDYMSLEVCCEECGWSGPHTELKVADIDCGDDYSYSDKVCPRCGLWDCCEFTYESLDTAACARLKPAVMLT